MEAVIKADWDYYRCYAGEELITYAEEKVRRFRDEELPDMYMHNFTAVYGLTEAVISRLWEEETDRAFRLGRDFFNLFYWGSTPVSLPQVKTGAAEPSHYVYMKGPARELTDQLQADGCNIARASTQQHYDDYGAFDIKVNGGNFGSDFCRRRSRHKSKVFAENTNLFLYLCYVKDQLAGVCEWFHHQETGLVKIEDFTVDPAMRGQGVGSAMLKQMITDAKRAGAGDLYLITEADNMAAQKLYQRFELERMDVVHVSWFTKLKDSQ